MATLNEIFDDARLKLEQRLTEARMLHSISTAETAQAMALIYDVNPEHALVAGLLHDWDKKYPDAQMIERAQMFGITLTDDSYQLLPVLHAQTAAMALSREYPDLPPEIIQAISRHSSAAIEMSDLDMIIYVADMLEPLRQTPQIADLRALIGKIPLQDLFQKCYNRTIEYLLNKYSVLDPTTLEIWRVISEN